MNPYSFFTEQNVNKKTCKFCSSHAVVQVIVQLFVGIENIFIVTVQV